MTPRHKTDTIAMANEAHQAFRKDTMRVSHTQLPGRPASLMGSRRKKALLLCSMAAPGALWLLLLRYLPMFGIVLAFKDYRAFKPNTFWNNIVKSEWVGFSNFEFLFKSPDTGLYWTVGMQRKMPKTGSIITHHNGVLPAGSPPDILIG